METTTIEFYKKNVYGLTKIYIKDENTAKNIQTLTKKKTVDERDIEALEALGVVFTQTFE